MFCFTKPDRVEVERFIAASAPSGFSYPYIGATRDRSPQTQQLENISSFNIDHNRIVIGAGKHDWERAKAAVRGWKMFDFSWVELCWPDTPIEEGRNVAILVSHLGFYSLNAARIVYTLNEPDRFGFAYGTLADHGESGEERFSIELDPETGEVWYDLFAFSRPNHFLARLGYPYTRRLQNQFAADSKAAMLTGVKPG